MKFLKNIFLLILLISNRVIIAQTPGGANSAVFRFTKEVWLNPTIILAKQNFEASTNVKLKILPRFNANDTSGSSDLEKAFDKFLSALVYNENVQGSIKIWFNPSSTTKPFSFSVSDELHCKFTPVEKDSVEEILNRGLKQGANLNDFKTLPFDSLITVASNYCKTVLQANHANCGPNPNNTFSIEKINTTPAKITFEKASNSSNANNGGVDKQQYTEYAGNYNSVQDVYDGNFYAVPWKAISTVGGNDNIKFHVKKRLQDFDMSRVKFMSADSSESYNVTPGNDSTLNVSITSSGSGTMKEVVAWYTPANNPTQHYALGLFNVYFYEPAEYKVVLVNLGGAIVPDQQQVKDTLNKIYSNTFVTWTVETASGYTLTPGINKNIHIESSGLLSNYMPDMQDIVSDFKDRCQAYQSNDDNKFYLLFGCTNDGQLQGYMPRARNTGFIFSASSQGGGDGSVYRTIAHELGHGAFHLSHIFSDDELGAGNRGLTNNIMDYSSGRELYKHQWDLVHNPGFVGWFDGDDEEGAMGPECDPSKSDAVLRALAILAKTCEDSWDDTYEPYRNELEKLKKLCFDSRIDLITCLASGYMDDEDQEGVINLISTTPKPQIQQLFDALKANSAYLLQEIKRGTSGSEFNILMDALIAKSIELNGIPEFSESLIKDCVANKKFVAFDQWKANNEYYTSNGYYSLQVRQNFHLCCEYELLSDPFKCVLVRFDNDFSVETNGRVDNYAAGTFMVAPAIFLPKIINEADNRTIRLTADIVGMYFGFTELKLALQGGKALTLALLEIGISATDWTLGVSLIDELNKTGNGQEVLNAWNTFAMCYGVARGSTGLYMAARNYYVKARYFRLTSTTLTYEQQVQFDKSINEAKQIIDENGSGSLSSADNEVNTMISGNGLPVPNSLISKLTQQGANKLKAWTNSKNLIYKPAVGESVTGSMAEGKIFEDIESSIGSKQVIETLVDKQGRLSVVLERPGQTNQVVSIHPTVSGEYKITTFEPAYNPDLNPSIPVPASANRLGPDYVGTQYMHPLQGNKVVKIKMSGNRNSDFSRARQVLGISLVDEQSSLYTWHHMDDFEIINGEAYCTMQLVQKIAHQGSGVTGMVHSGSVAQWKAYFGSGY